MAIGFPAGITEAYIVNNAQARLTALRSESPGTWSVASAAGIDE